MPVVPAQITTVWNRLQPRQRVVVVGAALATLAFIAALVFYGSQPEYGVLFSEMKPSDAQAVVEKLKTANVPYQLADNGTTVRVPSERITELRLQIASSGVLSGGHVGFDLFDKNSFGATDFAQQVNYQRALEGEMAKTLEGMDEVEAARVHLTRPRESLFADKAERAKASVVIRPKQGRELSRERTEAIVSLISSGVEGLDPADVSVMDTRGRLLSASERMGTGDAGAFNSHLEARRKLEAETAARIVALLEPVVGAGHVRADVAADVDFNQVEQTEEKYDPKSSVIRSQQTAQESRNTTAGGTGGVAGARANDPTTQANNVTTATPPTNADQRAATTTNYEIDKTVRRTVGGGGRITRLSASVVVDYKMTNNTAAARSPEELKKLQDLAAAAVGIDTSRGDQIVLQTVPFEQPMMEATAQSWTERNRELVRTGTRYGMLVLAALLLLIFVVRPAKRALRTASVPDEPAQLAAAPQTLQLEAATATVTTDGTVIAMTDEQRALDEASAPAALPDTSTPRTVAELEAEMEAEVARELAAASPRVKRADALKKQIIERTTQDPETIAMTLRGWLQEQQS